MDTKELDSELLFRVSIRVLQQVKKTLDFQQLMRYNILKEEILESIPLKRGNVQSDIFNKMIVIEYFQILVAQFPEEGRAAYEGLKEICQNLASVRARRIGRNWSVEQRKEVYVKLVHSAMDQEEPLSRHLYTYLSSVLVPRVVVTGDLE